jgi:hypothetical protein
VTWTDSSGNLWLFGGHSEDSTSSIRELNDLWKFDGTNWTWVSGSETFSALGVYGTNGTASPTNVPGARDAGVSWIDSSGNLWLFGGSGLDSAGTNDLLNDLWKVDGTNWTWVSGSSFAKQTGISGARGFLNDLWRLRRKKNSQGLPAAAGFEERRRNARSDLTITSTQESDNENRSDDCRPLDSVRSLGKSCRSRVCWHIGECVWGQRRWCHRRHAGHSKRD